MKTKEMTTEYRLAHWEQVMHDRKESGMSIKDYCESAGFPENRHFYRQRRLRATTCREIEEKVSEPGQALVPQGWARVNVSPASASPGSLPGGYYICVPLIHDPHSHRYNGNHKLT